MKKTILSCVSLILLYSCSTNEVKPRIAIAGLAIESSTFSPAFTKEEDFKARIGEDIFSFYPFLQKDSINRNRAKWIPTLRAHALPGGIVTKEAYGYVANGGFFPPNYAAGHISPVVDPDGVIRRFIPVLEYQGQYYEALPMAMVRQLFGIDSLVVERRETISEGYRRWHLNLDEYNDIFLPGLARIPIDRKGESLIPYHHNSGGFNYVSASDILAQRVPMSEMVGTIVLIGPTATGLYDEWRRQLRVSGRV